MNHGYQRSCGGVNSLQKCQQCTDEDSAYGLKVGNPVYKTRVKSISRMFLRSLQPDLVKYMVATWFGAQHWFLYCCHWNHQSSTFIRLSVSSAIRPLLGRARRMACRSVATPAFPEPAQFHLSCQTESKQACSISHTQPQAQNSVDIQSNNNNHQWLQKFSPDSYKIDHRRSSKDKWL